MPTKITSDKSGAVINGPVPYQLIDNTIGKVLFFADLQELKDWAAAQP